MTQRDIKFLLQGVLKIAPTPAYLSTLGYLPGRPKCGLCGALGGSFYHIESCCPVALDQGRYTWRHNEDLRVFHHAVGVKVRSMTGKKVKKVAPKASNAFVKAGDAPPKKKAGREPSILETASDWRIMVDLPGLTYTFPAHIAVTAERPDLIMWSEALKLIVLVELTVPSERNVQNAHKKKTEKYGKAGGLCDEIRARGWRVELMCVEVGTLGFVADATRAMMKRLGIWTKDLHFLLSQTALRCSYVIFVQRNTLSWTPWRMYRQ